MSDTMESVCVGLILGDLNKHLLDLLRLLEENKMTDTVGINPVTTLSRLPVDTLQNLLKKYPSVDTNHILVIYCTRDDDEKFVINGKYRSHFRLFNEMTALMKYIYCKIDRDDLKCSMLCFFSAIYDHVCDMIDRRDAQTLPDLEKMGVTNVILNKLFDDLRTARLMTSDDFMNYLKENAPDFDKVRDQHLFYSVFPIYDTYQVWGKFSPNEEDERKHRAAFVREMKDSYTKKYMPRANDGWHWGRLCATESPPF